MLSAFQALPHILIFSSATFQQLLYINRFDFVQTGLCKTSL